MEEKNTNLPEEETTVSAETPAADAAEPTETAQPEEKELWKKILKSPVALIAAGVVVLALVLSILSSAFSTPDFKTVKSGISYVELSENEYLIVFDSKNYVTLTDVDFEAVSPMQDAILYTDEDGALYYLEAGEKEGLKIADQADGATFSVDGKRFVYTVASADEEEDSSKYDLYVVESGKKESTQVASDITSVVPSPDCKSFYYSCNEDHYLYTGGKSEKVSVHEDYRILGISNKAKYVYSYKSEYLEAEERTKRTLYVQTGFDSDRVKLADNFSSGMYIFNYDATEICFEVEEAAYLSIKGEKAEKVMNQSIEDLLTVPNAVSGIYSVRAMPLTTFLGKQLVGGNDGLYTIGETSSETVKIASGIDDAVLSEDGASVLYFKEGELYRIQDLNSENDSVKIEMDLEIDEWEASPDLQQIYILTTDGDLYFVKGSSAPKKVESGSDVTYFSLSNDGKVCFVEKDEEWYTSSNGGKLKKISGIDEPAEIEIAKGFVLLTTEDAVYISKGDAKFEKIADIDFPEESTTAEQL